MLHYIQNVYVFCTLISIRMLKKKFVNGTKLVRKKAAIARIRDTLRILAADELLNRHISHTIVDIERTAPYSLIGIIFMISLTVTGL